MKTIDKFMRKTFVLLLLIGLTSFFHNSLHAQPNYPNRPVKLVVPFPSGGMADNLSRVYAKELSENIQSILSSLPIPFSEAPMRRVVALNPVLVVPFNLLFSLILFVDG